MVFVSVLKIMFLLDFLRVEVTFHIRGKIRFEGNCHVISYSLASIKYLGALLGENILKVHSRSGLESVFTSLLIFFSKSNVVN